MAENHEPAPVPDSNQQEVLTNLAGQQDISSFPDQEQHEMMTMFASVWVKVEVSEQESDINNSYNPDITPPNSETNPFEETAKTAKRKRQLNKTLFCDLCDYTTVYKNCLEIHMLGHISSKPFSCDACTYTTKYPSSLYRHVTIKHHDKAIQQPIQNGKPLQQLKCNHCDYSTYFKWNLYAHKRKHKLEKQYKCPHCDYETAYRHNFVKHSKVHKEGLIFKCDKCPFVTKYEGHIQRHLAKIHNEVTEKANMCDLCDFSTREKWRLNIHKQRSKQENVLKCSFCDFETSYMCQSKKHKITHYNEIYGNGRAVNCSNIYSEIDSMLSNTCQDRQSLAQNKDDKTIITHISETPKESTESAIENIQNDLNEAQNQTNVSPPKANKNKYTLDPNCVDWNNIQVLESDDKERPFQCHMCNYTSKFKASVQRHFQRHHTGTQNRPFKCCNCDFSTKTKDQIALHNKRSQSETQLFCVTCKFTTFFKCQYVMHQKCHYPHKCNVCTYSCKHKTDLTKHYVTLHLGNGLKCQYCDYKAARKESILCHETVHTGVKPFNCNYCEYMSVRKSLLDNHMKRYHSDIKQDMTVVSESKIQSLKVPLAGQIQIVGGEKHCQNGIEVPCNETVQIGVKSFNCNHCEYTSVRKSLLDNHMKRYHSHIKQDMTVVSESRIQSLRVPLAGQIQNTGGEIQSQKGIEMPPAN